MISKDVFKSVAIGTAMMGLSVISQANDWEKGYDGDGVQVYTRKIPGSSFLEFRGETIWEDDLASIVSLLWTAEDMPKWMDGCKRSEVKETVSDLERKIYLVNAAPGLLENRDLVLHNKVTQDPDTYVVHYSMEKIEYPINSDYVHVPKMNGFVELVPQGPGKTKVIYQAHLEAGGIVPGWAANWFVKKNPINTLLAGKKIVKSKSYPDHPAIKNYKG